MKYLFEPGDKVLKITEPWGTSTTPKGGPYTIQEVAPWRLDEDEPDHELKHGCQAVLIAEWKYPHALGLDGTSMEVWDCSCDFVPFRQDKLIQAKKKSKQLEPLL